MEDLGRPIAYLVLATGTPVFDRTGVRVGEVEHVLADDASDVFHGLLVRTADASNRHLFADRNQVGELYEHGVVLVVPADKLQEPSEDAVAETAANNAENPVSEELRQAWTWLKGLPH